MKISLLHATYHSKGQSRRVRDFWLAKAKNPELIEHCLGFESTDIQVMEEFDLNVRHTSGFTPDGLTKFKTTEPLTSPSAVRNWNAAAEISTGHVLLAIADDLVPEENWDLKVRMLVTNQLSKKRVWCLSDRRCTYINEFNDDLLPRHPLMTRALYENVGFFFDPRYVSVGPDNEWLLRGLRDGVLRDGRIVKLHHTEGKILNKTGEVICGCSLNHPDQIQIDSQIRMHDTRWVELARLHYGEWSKGWRLIGWIGTMEEWSSQLIDISRRFHFFFRNPQVLIFLTLTLGKMTLHSRFLLLKSLIVYFRKLSEAPHT